MTRPALENDTELLYRQVHPKFVVAGRATGQAFCPTAKDEGMLSVSRSSLTTAEGAFLLHTQGRKLQSDGSWALTVGEFRAETLLSYPDPTKAPPDIVPDDAHAVVDYTKLPSKKSGEKAGSRLARLANTRGRLHPPAVVTANAAAPGTPANDVLAATGTQDSEVQR